MASVLVLLSESNSLVETSKNWKDGAPLTYPSANLYWRVRRKTPVHSIFCRRIPVHAVSVDPKRHYSLLKQPLFVEGVCYRTLNAVEIQEKVNGMSAWKLSVGLLLFAGENVNPRFLIPLSFPHFVRFPATSRSHWEIAIVSYRKTWFVFKPLLLHWRKQALLSKLLLSNHGYIFQV